VTPDGERPGLMVAFLSIAPQAGATVNGVAFPVAEDELPGLDERERNYERVELDAALPRRVWAYAGLGAAGERQALGLREGRRAIASSYLARVLAGFEALGQRDRFERLTAPRPAPVADSRSCSPPPAPSRARSARPRTRWPCRLPRGRSGGPPPGDPGPGPCRRTRATARCRTAGRRPR
jgi:hypothetical protein